MPSREILNQLPYRLRSRFEWIGGYVKALLDTEETETKAKRKLTKSEVQLIQLIVFVHSLDFFFREGTRAARGAIGSLETLGVPGFQVGSTEFRGENENVTKGEDLANRLREYLSDNELLNSIPSDQTPTDLTKYLRRRIIRG